MTTTPPEAPDAPSPAEEPTTGPRVTRDEVTDLTRLRRTTGQDRVFAGVAGGIARHLDIDPIIVRVLLVVFSIFGGAGLLVYAAGWLFVPEEGTGRTVIHLHPRTRNAVLLVVAVAAVVFAAGATFGQNFPWPLALVAGAVIAWLALRDRRHEPEAPATYAAPVAPLATDPATPGSTTAEGGTAFAPAAAPWSTSEQRQAAPRGYAPPPPPRPIDPRKRGPILFPFVLAGIVLALGIVGFIDLTGVDVPAAVYPGAATAVIIAGLLVGAFWGRAGGLILIGLMGLVATGAVGAAQHNIEHLTFTPVTSASVSDRYTMHAGTFVLDLSHVQDPTAMAGREITIKGGVGQIVVIVPDDLVMTSNARVRGPGQINAFDNQTGGISVNRTDRHGTPWTRGSLRVVTDLGVGEIDVVTASQYAVGDYPR